MTRRLLFLLLAAAALPLLASDSKSFEATYIATVKDVPAGLKEMTVWIPLPVSRGGQTISDVRIESPQRWTETSEGKFGDRYAYATIANPHSGDFTVKVHFRGTRNEVTTAKLAETQASRAELTRALKADKLVTLSPRVKTLANEVTAGKTTPAAQAHAIYDYLVATMKYDKTIPGWGHGDTERACDIKAGNCTDFHSLFMSMARAKGIPARFVIGFPMTADHGTVTGYHCWAEFYVKGKGWIPVDPSEGSKSADPARRAYLFGNLDPDRVQFTMGRDLVLTPHTAEPLNYFIYPHAEADGKEVGTPAIALEY
jgi:transglutaminase-like putative cysteine protease